MDSNPSSSERRLGETPRNDPGPLFGLQRPEMERRPQERVNEIPIEKSNAVGTSSSSREGEVGSNEEEITSSSSSERPPASKDLRKYPSSADNCIEPKDRSWKDVLQEFLEDHLQKLGTTMKEFETKMPSIAEHSLHGNRQKQDFLKNLKGVLEQQEWQNAYARYLTDLIERKRVACPASISRAVDSMTRGQASSFDIRDVFDSAYPEEGTPDKKRSMAIVTTNLHKSRSKPFMQTYDGWVCTTILIYIVPLLQASPSAGRKAVEVPSWIDEKEWKKPFLEAADMMTEMLKEKSSGKDATNEPKGGGSLTDDSKRGRRDLSSVEFGSLLIRSFEAMVDDKVYTGFTQPMRSNKEYQMRQVDGTPLQKLLNTVNDKEFDPADRFEEKGLEVSPTEPQGEPYALRDPKDAVSITKKLKKIYNGLSKISTTTGNNNPNQFNETAEERLDALSKKLNFHRDALLYIKCCCFSAEADFQVKARANSLFETGISEGLSDESDQDENLSSSGLSSPSSPIKRKQGTQPQTAQVKKRRKNPRSGRKSKRAEAIDLTEEKAFQSTFLKKVSLDEKSLEHQMGVDHKRLELENFKERREALERGIVFFKEQGEDAKAKRLSDELENLLVGGN